MLGRGRLNLSMNSFFKKFGRNTRTNSRSIKNFLYWNLLLLHIRWAWIKESLNFGLRIECIKAWVLFTKKKKKQQKLSLRLGWGVFFVAIFRSCSASALLSSPSSLFFLYSYLNYYKKALWSEIEASLLLCFPESPPSSHLPLPPSPTSALKEIRFPRDFPRVILFTVLITMLKWSVISSYSSGTYEAVRVESSK